MKICGHTLSRKINVVTVVHFFLFSSQKTSYSHKTVKKAARTSHLPSFPPLIYPSYARTVIIIFYGHVHNIFLLHLELKNFCFKFYHFLGVRSPQAQHVFILNTFLSPVPYLSRYLGTQFKNKNYNIQEFFGKTSRRVR